MGKLNGRRQRAAIAALVATSSIVATAASQQAAAGLAIEDLGVGQVHADAQFRAGLGFPAAVDYVTQLDAAAYADASRLEFGAVFTPAEQAELRARNDMIAAA